MSIHEDDYHLSNEDYRVIHELSKMSYVEIYRRIKAMQQLIWKLELRLEQAEEWKK